MTSEPLACPRCARRYPLDERFCESCGMPLTYAGEVDSDAPVSDLQAQARKIRPEYSRGELRSVATASQQAEGEFIQMLLLEEGIPSTLRRTTWDVPEFLAAGPRAVLVPESGVAAAREVLRQSDLVAEHPSAGGPSPRGLLVGLAIAVAIVAALVWLAYSL